MTVINEAARTTSCNGTGDNEPIEARCFALERMTVINEAARTTSCNGTG
jgi:hypothetical protein